LLKSLEIFDEYTPHSPRWRVQSVAVNIHCAAGCSAAPKRLANYRQGTDKTGTPFCRKVIVESRSFLSREEWAKAIKQWADSRPKIYRPADDSRESIYAGRGE
jgi:hypothetical protein